MATLNYNWEMVSPVRRDRIEDGELAIISIDRAHRQNFRDWLRVGAALDDLQHAVQDLAGTNETKGSAYNAAWRVCTAHAPTLAALDKGTRSDAIWMHSHREIVEEWHASLPINLKRTLNHPRTIARKLKPKEEKEPKPKKTTEAALDHIAARLEAGVDGVERAIGGQPAFFDMAPELIAESAQNFVEIYGKTDTLRFIAELSAILQPASPATAEPKFDPAFKDSLAKPKRTRRSKVAVDDPNRPRGKGKAAVS